MSNAPVLGIDIGGSGIKGAPVNLETGETTAERFKIATPEKSTPKNVIKVCAQIVDHFADQLGDGPVGITVPAVVMHGVTRSAANIDQGWIGFDAEREFSAKLGRPVFLVNDADAAGVAEVKYGAAKDHPGLVIMTTLGTGIGVAIVHRGVLIPNAELGHIEMNGKDAEKQASSGVKEKKGMSYDEWIKPLNQYYSMLENLLWPDLFVVGGGISRNHAKFLPKMQLRTPIIPAELRNNAGIVGAAWLAKDHLEHPDPMPVHPEPVAADPQLKS